MYERAERVERGDHAGRRSLLPRNNVDQSAPDTIVCELQAAGRHTETEKTKLATVDLGECERAAFRWIALLHLDYVRVRY